LASAPNRTSLPRALGYGRQQIDESDVQAVVEVLRSDFLTQGPAVERFEEALCGATGAPYAVACSSGTAALSLANLALDVGEGREVVTSPNTFLASATATLHCGGAIDFVDVDPTDGNLDLERLERRLEEGRVPWAVTAVHFAGLPCDMERLLGLKRRFGFRLIEDAAHALGARYRADGRWWRVGEHPEVEATCLSFHPLKAITTAEGGAVLTADAEIARRVRLGREHGIDRAASVDPFGKGAPAGGAGRASWFAPMVSLGWNHRLSDLQAALGTSQLARLERFLARRAELAAAYELELAAALPFALEPPHPGDAEREHAWHLYCARVAPEARDRVMARLAEAGVRTQVHYVPVPLHPWFRERFGGRFDAESVRAREHALRAISLPLHPGLERSDVERVVGTLAGALEEAAAA